MHPRRAIREAVVGVLNAVPQFAGRVDTNRARPTSLAELPRVIIYTLSEENDQQDLDGSLQRNLSVGVEIRATASDDLDDALDALCEVVELAMAAKPTFAETADSSWLASTAIGLDGDGESRQALAKEPCHG